MPIFSRFYFIFFISYLVFFISKSYFLYNTEIVYSPAGFVFLNLTTIKPQNLMNDFPLIVQRKQNNKEVDSVYGLLFKRKIILKFNFEFLSKVQIFSNDDFYMNLNNYNVADYKFFQSNFNRNVGQFFLSFLPFKFSIPRLDIFSFNISMNILKLQNLRKFSSYDFWVRFISIFN